MSLAQVVTDLGNPVVASAAALVVLAFGWLRLNRLVAAVFAVGLVGVVALTAALKQISQATSPPPWLAAPLELSSGAPSGHVVLATVVYGCAAVLFVRTGKGLPALAGGLMSLAAILGVAVTRVTLQTHTLADVAAGFAVALPVVALFARAVAVQCNRGRVRVGLLLAGLILLPGLALLSGLRLSDPKIF